MSEETPAPSSAFTKALVNAELDYQDFPSCAAFVLEKTGQPGDINLRLLASAGLKPGDPHPYARPYKVIADLLDTAENFELFVQADGATPRNPERIILGWRETQIAEDYRLGLQIPKGHELARPEREQADETTGTVSMKGGW